MIIKQIKENPNYAVSDTGKIFSLTNNGLVELKQDISNGYPRVKLNGVKTYVSSIVAKAFLIPPKDERYKIFYIDGNKLNCNKTNLIWLKNSDVQRYSRYSVEYRKQVLGEW